MDFLYDTYLPPYPQSGLLSKLSTTSGKNWYSAGGDTTVGRSILSGRKLDVEEGDTIVFPAGTTTINITGTSEGSYVVGTRTWTATGAGTILRIDTDTDVFPVDEGSGTNLYSVSRISTTAEITGPEWGYQSSLQHYGNAHGYLISGGVCIPRLSDNSAFANGETTGGYVGKIALPAQFVQSLCATMPAGLAQSITSSSHPVAMRNVSQFSLRFRCNITSTSDSLPIGVRSDLEHYSKDVYMHILNVSGNLRCYLQIGNNVSGARIGYCSITTGEHEVVGVFDGTKEAGYRVKIYIDGVSKSLTMSGPSITTTPEFSTSQRFRIGFSDLTSGFWANNSRVWGIQLYTQALSDAEILSLYNTGVRPYTPSLEWLLCEGSGAKGWDIAGLNHWTTDMSPATMWANRWDDPFGPYVVYYGYQLYTGPAGYVVCPRRIDGTWQYPSHESYTVGSDTYTWVRDYPAITNGWNSNIHADVCMINLFPGSDGSTCPAEKRVVFDHVEDLCEAGSTWRGTRPSGGWTTTEHWKNFTLSLPELELFLGTSIDNSLERTVAYRTRTLSGESCGVDWIMIYDHQLSATIYNGLLAHYLKSKGV